MTKPSMPAQRSSRVKRPATAFGPAQPICWPSLSGEDEAAMLDQLSDWVDWATWRYALDHRVVPECWRQHGALLEELSALCLGSAARVAAKGTVSGVDVGGRVLEW